MILVCGSREALTRHQMTFCMTLYHNVFPKKREKIHLPVSVWMELPVFIRMKDPLESQMNDLVDMGLGLRMHKTQAMEIRWNVSCLILICF